MSLRVVVTGGAGFIGSHVVEALIEAGHSVLVIDDLSSGNLDWVHKTALFWHANLLDLDLDRSAYRTSMKTFFSEPDALINMASKTFIPDCEANPEWAIQNNIIACQNALQAIPARWVIQWSSSEVYGNAQEFPIKEIHRPRPISVYATSKLAQECLAWRRKDATVTVVRMFNAFGPRETHPYIVPEIIRQAESGKIFLGNIEAKRDFTYVEDVGRAVVALLKCWPEIGRTWGIFNICSGEEQSISTIIDAAARALGRKVDMEVCADRLRERDVQRLQGDSSLFRELTGWRPSVSFEDGITRTVKWFMDNNKRWGYSDGS